MDKRNRARAARFTPRSGRSTIRGFSMLEVLVSIFIMTVGLLGMAAMQVRAQQAELESYQRAQALILVSAMADRINANRKAAGCYAFTTATSGAPYAGSGGTAPTCGAYGTTETRTRANTDLSEWHNTLNGAAEQLSGSQVGAMIGARGCVSADTSSSPNVYRVSVAWQGLTKSVNPESVDSAYTCGKGQYGSDESLRRVVSITFPLACLSC
jgi:type IV pilus assembly protein PilV